MKVLSKLVIGLPLLTVARAVPDPPALRGRATVNLTSRTEDAEQLGSGFIYGWPDNGVKSDHTIPQELITGLGFRASRAGGSQLPAPALGWAAGGYDGYIGRFESALSNYRTTRKYGGRFILLTSDLWGADGGFKGPYPGDDGDWSMMKSFYDQVIGDLAEHDMLDALVFDIWNEPDLEIFWPRTWNQYLEYYVRAHEIVRKRLSSVLISGPSAAHSPSLDGQQWKCWMQQVSKHDAVPDIYSWHQIGRWEREPDSTVPDFHSMLEIHGLPQRPIDINEYAWPTEQNPANTAWYLAQLERHNLRGLRANWGSGSDLHDLMADLVYKEDGAYHPNGEWYVYKYYAHMQGAKASTRASEDLLFDALAVTSAEGVKILAGTRTVKADYEVVVNGLSSLGYDGKGTLSARLLRFDWQGKHKDPGGPKDLGFKEYSVKDDMLKITLSPATNSTAFAIEIPAYDSHADEEPNEL